MKRILLFLILMSFLATNSFAQKMIGFGGEVSVLSIKANARMWISKTTGFEVFAGPASELTNFKPNDIEAGFKILSTFLYNRTNRTYFGLVGKWKWIDVYGKTNNINLPIPGILIGKEWYNKKLRRKGFAIEFGYQYGAKEYGIFNPVNHIQVGTGRFEEFPLIVNFRYSFYKKK